MITEHRPGRYILHDLLRAYAAEQAAAACTDEETRAAIGRILEHYLYTMTAHPIFGQLVPLRALPAPGPGVSPEQLGDYPETLAWLETEHPVLRQAIEQAADTGRTLLAWQLYYCFAHSASSQGTWADYEAAAHTVLAAARRAGDDAGLGWTYAMLATFHAEFGPYDQVLPERYLALEHFERAGDLAGQANAHMWVSDALCTGRFKYGAMLWDDLSDPEVRRRASDGLAHAERAAALNREQGNPGGVMWSLLYCTYHHALLRDIEAARDCCEQASELARDRGNPPGAVVRPAHDGLYLPGERRPRRRDRLLPRSAGHRACQRPGVAWSTRGNPGGAGGNVSGHRRLAVGAPGLAAGPGAVREPAPPGRRADARPPGPSTRILGTTGPTGEWCAAAR